LLIVTFLTAYNVRFRRKHFTATSDTSVRVTSWVRWLITRLNLWLLQHLVKRLLKQGYLSV